jgi:hypothetical protein
MQAHQLDEVPMMGHWSDYTALSCVHVALCTRPSGSLPVSQQYAPETRARRQAEADATRVVVLLGRSTTQYPMATRHNTNTHTRGGSPALSTVMRSAHTSRALRGRHQCAANTKSAMPPPKTLSTDRVAPCCAHTAASMALLGGCTAHECACTCTTTTALTTLVGTSDGKGRGQDEESTHSSNVNANSMK